MTKKLILPALIALPLMLATAPTQGDDPFPPCYPCLSVASGTAAAPVSTPADDPFPPCYPCAV